MSTCSLHLPQSLHKNAKLAAAQEGISVNQFISTALAEKQPALATEDYLEQRAARASRSQFEAALALVPGVPAQDADRK